LLLIQSFFLELLGSTATSLSFVSKVPFSLLSTLLSAGIGVEVDAILVPFDAGGIRGELPIDGYDADGLLEMLPPFILAALSSCSGAAFSPKRPTCDNEAFSHASASC
jgi:hypothetical protein